MLTGAEIMVKCLEKEGVALIFGYPGAAICPFYDILYNSDIHHVLVRAEQNAAHAASGYSRVGNDVGVCIATSGPGATNLITGIATAYMDSIPLVAITGQVSLKDLGKDVFQEANITGACESFVKHSYLVTTAADLPRVFKEAFYVAKTGRAGPVLIDVPVDVQREIISDFKYPEKAEIIGYKPKIKGHSLQIGKAIDAIRKSKKPLLCCGGGIHLSGAIKEFCEFANKSGIPVVSTMMGLGVVTENNERFFGMMGGFGNSAANYALYEADLIVFCGARVADRAVENTENIKAKIIHIDIDPAEIGKTLRVDIPIVGDAKNVLTAFLRSEIVLDLGDWVNEIESKKAALIEPEPCKRVDPKAFMRTLVMWAPKDTILLADAGQSQIWAANNLCGKRLLTSGGLGTMGYSLPAAIGAKLKNRGAEVIAICGDGAFQMSMCELATLVCENAAIKIIIMDNGRLGMVRELQDQSFGGRHIATHMNGNPDFVKLASAYGIKARRAKNNGEARAFIEEMLSCDEPYVLVLKIDPNTTSA